MRFGGNYVLGSGARIVAIAVALFASTSFAQTIPPAQSSPSTSPTAPSATTTGQNPDTGPPRTAQPIPSAQEQPGQASTEQQPAPDRQEPIKPESSADDPGRFVFKKQVQEVVLHATVADGTGHLVTTLDRSAFSVYQNNQPEPITSFRREDVPVAMGIVVDNSGSMRDKREKVNHAVLNLIRASNPQDEIFVVNFSQNSYLDQDFTSDVNLLQAALHQVSTQGSTALYDAVVASAVHLRNNPRLYKKILLVITDGQDNMSRETLQEAIRKLQPNNGLTVYAIGLTDEGLRSAGREALQNLASTTGGVAFFPQSLDEVNAITRTVAHDIRSQYTLAYKPQAPTMVIRRFASKPRHREAPA
jgi:Ca-activated chloride channel homolog